MSEATYTYPHRAFKLTKVFKECFYQFHISCEHWNQSTTKLSSCWDSVLAYWHSSSPFQHPNIGTATAQLHLSLVNILRVSSSSWPYPAASYSMSLKNYEKQNGTSKFLITEQKSSNFTLWNWPCRYCRNTVLPTLIPQSCSRKELAEEDFSLFF